MASEEEWAKQGVEFKVVTEEMIPDVLDHLNTSFFPDEPIFRSLGINLDTSPFLKSEYRASLMDGTSIAAVNPEGRIMAVRVGNIIRSGCGSWFILKMYHMFKAMPCLLPDWINVFLKLGDRVGYVAYEQFSKLDAQVLYEDKAVSSARWHGVKGLGSELIRRTEALAKEQGATHTFALVTGKYSAIAFDRLGHTLVSSLKYAEFTDPQGELYLKDTREHTECRFYTKEL